MLEIIIYSAIIGIIGGGCYLIVIYGGHDGHDYHQHRKKRSHRNYYEFYPKSLYHFISSR